MRRRRRGAPVSATIATVLTAGATAAGVLAIAGADQLPDGATATTIVADIPPLPASTARPAGPSTTVPDDPGHPPPPHLPPADSTSRGS